MTMPSRSGAPRALPDTTAIRAADLLHEARTHERAGCLVEAMACYQQALAEARRTEAWTVQAEALRRLAVLHHHRGEADAAQAACEESYAIAVARHDEGLAAEALNVRGGIANERGDLEQARALFGQALALGGTNPGLVARIAQNLGINANVRGELAEAVEHYSRSLDAYRRAGNDHGCAIAYHNLGMVSADREQWDEADRYFGESRAIAERLGDLQLQGLCLLNHAEVHVARQRFDQAKTSAEAALAIFDQLGSLLDKTDAYRVIGLVFRETGRTALAESRLKASIELAGRTGSMLCEAEASRELALLYQVMGRNQEALSLLNAAHGLFGRLDARTELVDVSRKVAQLEETFLSVVRDWGQSIESSDSYTFGHCERVASYAEQVARELGLPESEITTVRLGAYLHDVGKIRVPHEILNKPGRLTNDEFEIIKMHPLWGVELLEGVEFPWGIKPIIRWHHEKYDGTGYPDRLRGDEIPLNAMIIGIVDVYDALTTTRSYRGAMAPAVAAAEMERSRHWWRQDVYEAFRRALAAELASAPASQAA
jgi:putative nucleotidyltransferase with HDIG domain